MNDIMEKFDNQLQKSDWYLNLDLDSKGKPTGSHKNFMIFLENDKELKGLVYYNEFTHKLELLNNTPWNRSAMTMAWEDGDFRALRVFLNQRYGVSNKDALNDVLYTFGQENSAHPVKEYLEHLPQWDGVKRMETLFIDYLGVADTELNRKQTELFFMASVSRIYKPGCKWDYLIVFKGKQGSGKSTLILDIVPSSEWFTDTIKDINSKDTCQLLEGVWIVELAEMMGLNKKEAEDIKSWISRRSERYRPAYGQTEVLRHRQCVFIGTTNKDRYINDPTGGRRFWNMDCTESYWENKESKGEINIQQLWAEVMYFYNNQFDGKLALSNELEQQANEIQKEQLILGVFQDDVESILDNGYMEHKELGIKSHADMTDEGWLQKEDSDNPGYLHYYKPLPYRICAKLILIDVLKHSEQSIKQVDIERISAIIENHPMYVNVGKKRVKGYGQPNKTFERIQM